MDPAASGLLSCSPPSAGPFPEFPGAFALGFSPGCLGVNPCTVDLNPDATVTSYVTTNTRKRITVDVAGSATSGFAYSVVTLGGMSVTNGGCDGDCVIDGLDPGLRVTLFPVIDANQGVFFGWGGDCASSGTNSSCELVMSRNLSVTILYASLPVPAADFPTLTIQTDGNGCVSANGPNGTSGCLIFDSFGGDCTFSDADTIVMDHACTVFGVFTDTPITAPARAR